MFPECSLKVLEEVLEWTCVLLERAQLRNLQSNLIPCQVI
jgi:hypothetical protein